MDLILIGRLMEMLENSALNELEVTEDGVRIRLAKTPRGVAANGMPSALHSETPETQAAGEIAALMALRTEVTTSGEVEIAAGLPGTFYRAPAPGAEPFAEVGARVEEGQTLGLIEAMKMLNPVEAPCAGRLKAFLLDDATPVETGMPLILINVTD